MREYTEEQMVRIAMIDNIEVRYDVCSQNINSYDNEPALKIEYLGYGIIWKINDVMQGGFDKYYFWRRV